MNHQKIKEHLRVNGEVFKYLFHIRQVTDLHYAYLTEMVKPVSLDYSGWE
jgi:hypothetical protein